ncbi:hypothetical protein DL89DRAFT_182396 [Linderina pennispora]|uniref:Uncharacterized protein n=1 Tax=Linderina pennispora TaxID=61395 RepID=A0A1Y1W5M7_9FUNG|nr:uncharacterized protein DL89DRAFT_182396 [Linderina pennispora]ORX68702.1 hypothetical protein DL89DRAFT_182396 [Linderina pennispora]
MARIPFGQPGPVSACVLLFALSSIVAATTNIPATMTSARALPPGLSMRQTRKIQLFGDIYARWCVSNSECRPSIATIRILYHNATAMARTQFHMQRLRRQRH